MTETPDDDGDEIPAKSTKNPDNTFKQPAFDLLPAA